MYNSKVCLIHYESDKNIAENLEYTLNKYGISVWREDQIELGSRTSEEIKKAIDSARIVIVLWSTNSVKSALLKEQAERAKKRTALIPVLIDNVKLPSESVGTQAANLVGWNGEEDNKEFIKLRQLIQEPRLFDVVKSRFSAANWNTIASISGVIVAASGVIVTALINNKDPGRIIEETPSGLLPNSNDYTELSRLLKEKKWREADIKTRGIMHKIAHVKAEGKED